MYKSSCPSNWPNTKRPSKVQHRVACSSTPSSISRQPPKSGPSCRPSSSARPSSPPSDTAAWFRWHSRDASFVCFMLWLVLHKLTRNRWVAVRLIHQLMSGLIACVPFRNPVDADCDCRLGKAVCHRRVRNWQAPKRSRMPSSPLRYLVSLLHYRTPRINMNSNFTNPSHSSLQVQQAEEGGQSSVDQTVAVRHGKWRRVECSAAWELGIHGDVIIMCDNDW